MIDHQLRKVKITQEKSFVDSSNKQSHVVCAPADGSSVLGFCGTWKFLCIDLHMHKYYYNLNCVLCVFEAEVDRLGSRWVLSPRTRVQRQSGVAVFQGSRTACGLPGKNAKRRFYVECVQISFKILFYLNLDETHWVTIEFLYNLSTFLLFIFRHLTFLLITGLSSFGYPLAIFYLNPLRDFIAWLFMCLLCDCLCISLYYLIFRSHTFMSFVGNACKALFHHYDVLSVSVVNEIFSFENY